MITEDTKPWTKEFTLTKREYFGGAIVTMRQVWFDVEGKPRQWTYSPITFSGTIEEMEKSVEAFNKAKTLPIVELPN